MLTRQTRYVYRKRAERLSYELLGRITFVYARLPFKPAQFHNLLLLNQPLMVDAQIQKHDDSRRVW